MLKLKNARPLGRAEMKKLTGGADTAKKGRLCPGDCIIGEDERYCRHGQVCQIYYCDPDQDKYYAYRCL